MERNRLDQKLAKKTRKNENAFKGELFYIGPFLNSYNINFAEWIARGHQTTACWQPSLNNHVIFTSIQWDQVIATIVATSQSRTVLSKKKTRRIPVKLLT